MTVYEKLRKTGLSARAVLEADVVVDEEDDDEEDDDEEDELEVVLVLLVLPDEFVLEPVALVPVLLVLAVVLAFAVEVVPDADASVWPPEPLAPEPLVDPLDDVPDLLVACEPPTRPISASTSHRTVVSLALSIEPVSTT